MMNMLIRIITLVLLTITHSLLGKSVTLIKNGQPVSIIVTADVPTTAAQQGAKDLQMWLQRSSGAMVPIKSESDISKTEDQALILIGESKRTQKLGINPKDLELEEIVVRTFPNALVIIGDDQRPDGYPLNGTVLAVDVFVEDILGVKVLWPGELGEIVPRQSTIEADNVDIRQKPILVDRVIDNHGFNGVTHTKIDALGWDRERYRAFQEKSEIWYRFHRLGGSYNGSFGHAFGNYWQRFHEEHPDWFALQPDGTRDNSQPEHALYESHRLCVSNQELIKQVAKDCMEGLENNPTLDAVSVSPNDGGPQTFCLCENCEAWDAAEGDTVFMSSKDGSIPHVSLTDRFVRFYSQVAEIVAKKYPHRNLGAYAYSLYTTAPIHAKLHPNVVIGFVPGTKMYQDDADRERMRENWLKWSKAAQKLFLRPNSVMALHALPTNYVHRLGADMRFFTDHNMLFARYDCHFLHWATNSLNYYVLAKLLWNPYRDVDALVDEFCTVGFGPAAGVIKRYFDEIETITNAIAAERQRPTSETIVRYYSDETLQKLNGILDEADLAAGYDAVIKERVAFVKKGLEYTPICRDYMLAKDAGRDGDKWQWRKYLEESVRRATWFQNLGPSRIIHAPWLMYWDW